MGREGEYSELRKHPSLDPSVAKGVSSSLAATCKAKYATSEAHL